MEKILINPADIESCWEKNDACFVKTKSGKVWVCQKYLYEPSTQSLEIHIFEDEQVTTTLGLIKHLKNEKLVELTLLTKRGGNSGK